MAGEEPSIEPAKPVGERIDPETGATIIIYDNPEGDDLAAKSRARNTRIRARTQRGFGVGGAAVGGESGRKIQGGDHHHE